MGVSTCAIGLLPTFSSIGIAAPVALAIPRFGQGIGLGGEWGGAALIALEDAPAEARACFGIFPQLGAPVVFFLASLSFIFITRYYSARDFLSYGWRLPFLASAVLVMLGLRYRISLEETTAFLGIHRRGQIARFPFSDLLRRYPLPLLAGTLASIATFMLFYIVSIFCLKWDTTSLGYSRPQLLLLQLYSTPLFAMTMPIAAYIAERSQILAMLGVTICIGIFGMAFAPLFLGGPTSVTWMFCISMCLMGLTYGPLSTLLADLFPPPVRYTGCSLCYRLGAILGASMAPYTAQWLAEHHGLNAVGTYISLSSAVTIIGLLLAQFLQSSEPSTLYHDDPVSDVA